VVLQIDAEVLGLQHLIDLLAVLDVPLHLHEVVEDLSRVGHVPGLLRYNLSLH